MGYSIFSGRLQIDPSESFITFGQIMDWLSQNWIGVMLAIGVIFMMSRGTRSGHGPVERISSTVSGEGGDPPHPAPPPPVELRAPRVPIRTRSGPRAGSAGRTRKRNR